MATLEEVERAFMRAHQAGDRKNAQILADEVRRLRAAPPAAPSAASQVEGASAPVDGGPTPHSQTDSFVSKLPVVGALGRTGDLARATEGIPILGALAHQADAAATAFIDTATFGVSPRLAAWLDSQTGGTAYTEALQRRQAAAGALAADAPVASFAGNVGGLVAGGGGLGMAAKAGVKAGARALGQEAALAEAGALAGKVFVPQAGSGALNMAANTGRLMASGAAGGAALDAAQALGHDKDVGQAALEGGLLGGAAGPFGSVVGSAAGKVMPLLAPHAEKAWGKLAKAFGDGMDPQTLARAATEFEAKTGRKASIAELLDARNAGVLRDLGGANQQLGLGLRQHADEVAGEFTARATQAEREAAQALPGQWQSAVERTTGRRAETVADLNRTREAADEAFFQAPASVPGVTRQDLPATITRREAEELLTHPMVQRMTRNDPRIQERMAAANEALGNPNVSRIRTFTLNDIENFRAAARDVGERGVAFDKRAASELGDRMVRAGGPDYTQHMAQQAGRRQYIEGFEQGATLRPQFDADGRLLLEGPAAEGFASGLTSGSVRRAQQGGRAAARELEDIESATFQQALRATRGPAEAEELTAAARGLREGYERVAKGQTEELRTLRTGAENARASAPASFERPETAGDMLRTGADLALTVASPSLGGSAHAASRVLRGDSSVKLSPKMEQTVLRLVTSRDPKSFEYGIRVLEKAGARRETINELRAATAAAAGANFAGYDR